MYGSSGTGEVVDGVLAMLAPDIRYRLAHHDDLTSGPQVRVHEVTPGDRLTIGSTTVVVGATDHRPVEPTVGYRVEADTATVVIGAMAFPVATLDELCAGADIYVQTVLRRDLVEAIPLQALQDMLEYHSSVQDAADTAARAGVDTLVLTHYIPGPPAGTEDEWRALAAERFNGRIVVGDDLTVVQC